uniref:TF-B3 domain-containing protein n=1 Tax=Setaria italica TaxID=4555 RepID=K3YCW5_SETIT
PEESSGCCFWSHGKIWKIELEINQSDVFFAGGWSQFMVFHGITAANSLLFRYEGNMMFTVKVFEPNGCQRDSKHKQIGIQQRSTLPNFEKQQEAPSSIKNCKSKSDWPSDERQKIPKGSIQSKLVYEIGPPSWIKKVIDTNTLENHISLSTAFCDAIGLWGHFTIMLKISINSTQSWKVHGASYKNSSYTLVLGWKRFFQENNLKEGDICTFNIIKTTLWHVVITRFRENMNQFCYQETPEREKDWSCSDGQIRPKYSVTYLKQTKTKCVFEIGPPAWIRKEINAITIEKHLVSISIDMSKLEIW